MSEGNTEIVAEQPVRLLICEDSREDAEHMVAALKGAGHAVVYDFVRSAREFQKHLETQYDATLCGHDLGAWSGTEALELQRRSGKDIPFIVVAGVIGEEAAVEYMKQGASDFLLKSRLERLPSVLRRAMLEKAKRSERAELETRRRQAQKMEAIESLAGGVAHDFNNLLGIVSGYAELLAGELGSAPQRYLEQINNAIRRGTNFTNQLLAFSRRQPLQLKVLDLNAVVTDTQKTLRSFMGQDVEIVTELQPELGAVCADPGQLRQTLMNLAANAREAMPEGGTLTIRTADAELKTEPGARPPHLKPGDYVLLSVADTGKGISPEVKERVFEPLFTTKEKKHAGFGLAVVHGGIEQSGGYISVISEPGKGARFDIYLPKAS